MSGRGWNIETLRERIWSDFDFVNDKLNNRGAAYVLIHSFNGDKAR